MTIDRDATLDAFRAAVLRAFDETAAQLFVGKVGWNDQDLAKLFPAIDRHTETLVHRYNVMLCD